jgi:hypothetical protein
MGERKKDALRVNFGRLGDLRRGEWNLILLWN